MKKTTFKSMFIALSILIFAFILALNLYTTLLVDDYAYVFSFSDRTQRIGSIQDIISSMTKHRLTMNGRVIAHFFVQLFLWVSPELFRFVNAAVFTVQVLLIYYISTMNCKNVGV